jgi:crossover junction endodeoxyribonuclease RusA
VKWEIAVPLVVRTKTGVRPLTHNDRLHWRPKAALVASIRKAVWVRVKNAKIPTAEHVTVRLHYATGDRRSVTDAPNLTATSKPAIDALVDAGVVKTDTDEHVSELMPVVHRGPGERRLWLEVEVTVERAA